MRLIWEMGGHAKANTINSPGLFLIYPVCQNLRGQVLDASGDSYQRNLGRSPIETEMLQPHFPFLLNAS